MTDGAKARVQHQALVWQWGQQKRERRRGQHDEAPSAATTESNAADGDPGKRQQGPWRGERRGGSEEREACVMEDPRHYSTHCDQAEAPT